MGISRRVTARTTELAIDERHRVLLEALALNERMEAGQAELAHQIELSNRLRVESWERRTEPTKTKRRA